MTPEQLRFQYRTNPTFAQRVDEVVATTLQTYKGDDPKGAERAVHELVLFGEAFLTRSGARKHLLPPELMSIVVSYREPTRYLLSGQGPKDFAFKATDVLHIALIACEGCIRGRPAVSPEGMLMVSPEKLSEQVSRLMKWERSAHPAEG